MKKITSLILIIILSVSICINIILSVMVFSNKKDTGNKTSNSILGIYQTQYLNNYNHSMTMTLKLYEGGKGKCSNYATEYSNKENDCTWEETENGIVIIDSSGNTSFAEILQNGDLLLDNFHLKKIK